jgi:hypothetical protein
LTLKDEASVLPLCYSHWPNSGNFLSTLSPSQCRQQ